MAVDAYVKFDGVDGESKADGHAGESDILSFSFGMSQSSGATSGSAGSGAGKVSMQDVSISKVMDKASAKIGEDCATGAHVPKVTITVAKAGGKQNIFLTYTLTDCFISSYSTGLSSGGSDLPMESVTISFKHIKVEYKPQAATGATGTPIPWGFSLETFKKD